MLFTPSPPLPSQPISSSIGSESSPTHIASISNGRNVENQLHNDFILNNSTLTENGPSNNLLLSTSESRFSQLSDQENFYSPFSTSPPSAQLTPITNIKLSDAHRRDSCPISPTHKKLNQFHFPRSITSPTRNVLMAKIPSTTNREIDHTEDLSKTTLWSNNTIIPIANPFAAAALVEDDEMAANEEQLPKSLTPSPMSTPKDSQRLHRSPTDVSASLLPYNIYTNRKVVLNVGGVRHEGNSFFLSVLNRFLI
jgi:hypothetical protein